MAVKHQLAGGIRWIVSKPATLRILLAALQTLLCRWDITNDVGDGADALASNPTNRFYCIKKKTMSPEAIAEAQVASLRTTNLEGRKPITGTQMHETGRWGFSCFILFHWVSI